MLSINAWDAVDNAVLTVFRDGQPRMASEVFEVLPGFTHRVIRSVLDANVRAGWLVAGELTYQITSAGQQHLAATSTKVA